MSSLRYIRNQAKVPLFAPWQRLRLCFMLFFSLGCQPVMAQNTDELVNIQQQIKAKQANLKKQMAEAETIQKRLQKAELDIANTAKQLNQTEAELKNNHIQQQTLGEQQQEYTQALKQQQSSLAKQIRSAYMTGNYDFAKMLLNQQDAANFERSITYYQYLNKARKQQIDSFKQLVKDLQAVNQELRQKSAELARIKTRQAEHKQALTAQKVERAKALKAMQVSIQNEELNIAQLQLNEKNLANAIAKAQQLAEEQARQRQAEAAKLSQRQAVVSLTGLTARKGKLLMPAEGRLRKMFGRFRQGQIKWKGIVIYGDVGAPVVAIHDAKVLYADWLRGFGLVTVLDHGNGYMSLYGHNQALLRKAGDTVTAGEPIALLGQSGGQTRPNLYFEIRHKGKPINPTNWLKL